MLPKTKRTIPKTKSTKLKRKKKKRRSWRKNWRSWKKNERNKKVYRQLALQINTILYNELHNFYILFKGILAEKCVFLTVSA